MASGSALCSAKLAPVGLLLAALLAGCPQLLADGFAIQDSNGFEPIDAGGILESDRDGGTTPLPTEPADAGTPAPGSTPIDASSGPPLPNDSGPDEAVPTDSGQPDASSADGGATESSDLAALHSALIHRYRFDGAGPTVVDSVGTADGVCVGAQLSGGAALLAGTEPSTPQYIDLPNGLISGLQSVTLEAWVYWDVDPTADSSSWQRIFDFGSNSSTTEGQQGSNAHDLYLTPKSGSTSGVLHFEYRSQDNGDYKANGPSALPARSQVQVAAVLDASAQTLTIYQDGVAQNTATSAATVLSVIPDTNNWLGRSQYDGDPDFQGQILDFRIYASALSPGQIQLSQSLGPDADL